MKKTVWTVAAGLLVLMLGIVLGRWSLLRQGALIQGGGSAVVMAAPLVLREAEPSHGDIARKININTASVAELTELPGIGEAIAGRIVAYRREYGDFQSVAEIKAVRGIGDGVFAAIAPYITIE